MCLCSVKCSVIGQPLAIRRFPFKYIASYLRYSFDTHGTVHRRLLSRNTNKMQLCNRIYYSKVSLKTQHVTRGTPLIIRRSVFAASGLHGDRPLPRLSGRKDEDRGRNRWFGYKATKVYLITSKTFLSRQWVVQLLQTWLCANVKCRILCAWTV